MLLLTVALLASGCLQTGRQDQTCPSGTTTYSPADVVLQLDDRDSDHIYRLPLGKVVVSTAGGCVSGDALEALGRPAGRSPAVPDGWAFRGAHVGRSTLSSPYQAAGEAGLKAFLATINVTEACVPLTRDQAIDKALNRNPVSRPQGSSPPPGPNSISAKLMSPGQYLRYTYVPGQRIEVADSEVWGVLMAYVVAPQATQWVAVAVDPCTDRVFGQWLGTTRPSGWDQP
jgi:hypothetical protein